MKENNNKGFTLIELLAVVVILLAVSVIAITSIGAAIDRNKVKQNKSKYTTIESAAMTYYSQHKNSLTTYVDDGSYAVIELTNLDLSDSEVTDANGDKICGYVYTFENTRSKKTIFRFIEDVGGCSHSTSGTPYYGDVDLNGSINATDALWVKQYLLGTRELNNQQKLNADINADGRIKYSDSECILKVSTGNVTGGGNIPANCGDTEGSIENNPQPLPPTTNQITTNQATTNQVTTIPPTTSPTTNQTNITPANDTCTRESGYNSSVLYNENINDYKCIGTVKVFILACQPQSNTYTSCCVVKGDTPSNSYSTPRNTLTDLGGNGSCANGGTVDR